MGELRGKSASPREIRARARQIAGSEALAGRGRQRDRAQRMLGEPTLDQRACLRSQRLGIGVGAPGGGEQRPLGESDDPDVRRAGPLGSLGRVFEALVAAIARFEEQLRDPEQEKRRRAPLARCTQVAKRDLGISPHLLDAVTAHCCTEHAEPRLERRARVGQDPFERAVLGDAASTASPPPVGLAAGGPRRRPPRPSGAARADRRRRTSRATRRPTRPDRWSTSGARGRRPVAPRHSVSPAAWAWEIAASGAPFDVAPCRRSSMELGEELWLAPLQLGEEEASELVVVPVPLAPPIERHHEQVRGRDRLELPSPIRRSRAPRRRAARTSVRERPSVSGSSRRSGSVETGARSRSSRPRIGRRRERSADGRRSGLRPSAIARRGTRRRPTPRFGLPARPTRSPPSSTPRLRITRLISRWLSASSSTPTSKSRPAARIRAIGSRGRVRPASTSVELVRDMLGERGDQLDASAGIGAGGCCRVRARTDPAPLPPLP